MAEEHLLENHIEIIETFDGARRGKVENNGKERDAGGSGSNEIESGERFLIFKGTDGGNQRNDTEKNVGENREGDDLLPILGSDTVKTNAA